MEKIEQILKILFALLLVASAILIVEAFDKPQEKITSYSYTTAICTDSNLCQDYVIECQGPVLKSKTPIEGASVQFSKDWKDPREPLPEDYSECS